MFHPEGSKNIEFAGQHLSKGYSCFKLESLGISPNMRVESIRDLTFPLRVLELWIVVRTFRPPGCQQPGGTCQRTDQINISFMKIEFPTPCAT